MTNNELTSHLFRYSKLNFFVGLKLILSYNTENTIFEIDKHAKLDFEHDNLKKSQSPNDK